MSVCLSVYLCVCLSIYLSVFFFLLGIVTHNLVSLFAAEFMEDMGAAIA